VLWLQWFQASFVVGVGIVCVKVSFLGVEVSSIVKVKVLRYWLVKILWYQGVGVCCKYMGALIGESTLLLDFETFKAKHSTV
jgi:hypothetical protein